MRTRTQEFALRAYPLVEIQANENETTRSDGTTSKTGYRTLALTFPNMILQSGLSQATGFLQAKGKLEHTIYLNNLAHVMAGGLNDGASLHQRAIASDMVSYQQLTRRALEASAWLKRYTQALLKAEEGQ
jgi:CRISPR-associated protein Cmr5